MQRFCQRLQWLQACRQGCTPVNTHAFGCNHRTIKQLDCLVQSHKQRHHMFHGIASKHVHAATQHERQHSCKAVVDWLRSDTKALPGTCAHRPSDRHRQHTCMQRCWGSAELCLSQIWSASSDHPVQRWGLQGSGQHQGMSGIGPHHPQDGSCMSALDIRGRHWRHIAPPACNPYAQLQLC